MFSHVAVDHYGSQQLVKAKEELLELDRALSRYVAAGFPPSGTRGHNRVTDEVADVLVMAMQVRHMFGPEEVDKRIAYKIERQRKRMREGK